jgi:hypothetical protein
MKIGRFTSRYNARLAWLERRGTVVRLSMSIRPSLYSNDDVAKIAARHIRHLERLMRVRCKWWALPWWRRVVS